MLEQYLTKTGRVQGLVLLVEYRLGRGGNLFSRVEKELCVIDSNYNRV